MFTAWLQFWDRHPWMVVVITVGVIAFGFIARRITK